MYSKVNYAIWARQCSPLKARAQCRELDYHLNRIWAQLIKVYTRYLYKAVAKMCATWKRYTQKDVCTEFMCDPNAWPMHVGFSWCWLLHMCLTCNTYMSKYGPYHAKLKLEILTSGGILSNDPFWPFSIKCIFYGTYHQFAKIYSMINPFIKIVPSKFSIIILLCGCLQQPAFHKFIWPQCGFSQRYRGFVAIHRLQVLIAFYGH